MTIASFLLQRRRVLLLCFATIALHGLLLGWVATDPGPVRSDREPAPQVVSMRLASPLPALSAPTQPIEPIEPIQPARPQAAAAPRRAPMIDAAQPGEAAPVNEAAQAADPAPPAPVASTAPNPPNPPNPPSTVPDPADAAPPQRYRVRLPPSADLALDVQRVDPDGATWAGAGAMAWRQDGSNYSMTVEAGLNLLVARVNLLVITSEGQIDDNGIAPVTATEKRKGRALTATHFNRAQRRITFSASEQTYPLLSGAQDKATLPFQLAGIGRADVNQFQGNIDLFVGEDREANVFRFHLVGEEELDTKMGRLLTWHLSRPPKPGTYSSKLDIWLAPGSGWYPVQIRNTEANGAVTTQSVTRITAMESPGT
jgi:hypothetical protein